MRKKLQRLSAFTQSSPSILFLAIELIIGIVIVLASLYAFADLAKDTLFDHEVGWFDQTVSHAIYAWRSPVLNEVMMFISLLGADFILVIASVFCIFLVWKNHKRESFIFFITLGFGALLNLLLKEIFQRARPTMSPLLELSSYSFPSGHSMNSFVFYAVFAYFTFHFTKNFKLSLFISFLCAVIILLIGISRIYLGVHYPTDVLAGYIAGLFWFILVLVIERTIIFFNLFKNYKKKK